ncbi:bifunctional riboflavin kinase/FAD synthetase [Flavobacteriaceae bacterium F08102]|nr:bifunctional riboflavin kinase/FAD synthetase [Flavobacteriaceae bacterium F08102]
MKIYQSIAAFKAEGLQSIATIGTFDGVHIGHQEIIKNLVEQTEPGISQSVILTFFPHPRMILQDGNSIKMLSTLDEKIQLLENLGLDCLIIEPFTKEFSRLTARDFVRNILVDRLKLKKLIIGYDHQFGRNREGNFEQLQEFGAIYNFDVAEIPAQDIKNIAVSSTKIRNALSKGEIEKATKYLGHPYQLSGKVIKGKGLGRKYNYPTINIEPKEDYKLIPKEGVYIVTTTLHNQLIYGIMNIGLRPTVDGQYQTIEVHLLDINENLYGQTVEITFHVRLRDEQKFESIEALFEQIKQDEFQARKLIESGQIPI